MMGKTVQPSPRVKRTAFNGRHQQKDDGSGQGETILARSASTSHQSNLRSPKRDMDISSANFTRHVPGEDRLSSSAKDERSRDSTRRRSSERKRERALVEDDRQQSKVGKFKNKIRSGGMKKERDLEAPTERDGANVTSSGGRAVPILSQRTPPKRRVFKNGDFPGKPGRAQHRSKSTPRQHPDLRIDSSLLGEPEVPHETNHVKVNSGSSAGEATSSCDNSSQLDWDDLNSPGSTMECHNPNSHRRLGPRTTTASDILAILSPRKKGGGHGVGRHSSNVNTTGPPGTGSVAHAMDLTDITTEHDVLDDDSTPPKRAGLKLQKKTLRRKHDRLEKTSTSISVGSNLSSLSHHCATDLSSPSSQDIDIDKAASDDKIANSLDIQELRKQLHECELEVQALTSAAARNEQLFRAEIERFKSILGTVDQAQELRYISLLEVFTDNFKTMGTVEARFEQMLGARHGQMQTSGRGRLLQFLWVLIDFSVKAMFQVAQTIYRSHKFIKGQR